MTINTFSASNNFNKPSFCTSLLNTVPAEGVAFLAASLAVRIFSVSLSIPLLGIGLSILTTRLVLKTIEWYDSTLLITLTKEACKLNKKYPKLLIITCVSAMVISLISATFSLLIGACLGSFSSIILEVESYKLKQQANRTMRETYHSTN